MRRSKKVVKRIDTNLKKFKQLFATAVQNDLNEADTRVIILDFMHEVLGYDKFSEVTGEYRVRGEFIDLAVKIEGEIKLLIEIKSAKTELKENHLRQVTSYAANKGTEWAVLTNGPIWQLYHISFEQPIDVKMVFELDILDEKYQVRAQNLLYLLTRESVMNNGLSDYWGQSMALTPSNILKVLFSVPVLKKIRQQLFAATRTKPSLDDLKKSLEDNIVRQSIDEIPKPFERRQKRKRREAAEEAPVNSATDVQPPSLPTQGDLVKT
jgi:hypothetical protein